MRRGERDVADHRWCTVTATGDGKETTMSMAYRVCQQDDVSGWSGLRPPGCGFRPALPLSSTLPVPDREILHICVVTLRASLCRFTSQTSPLSMLLCPCALSSPSSTHSRLPSPCALCLDPPPPIHLRTLSIYPLDAVIGVWRCPMMRTMLLVVSRVGWQTPARPCTRGFFCYQRAFPGGRIGDGRKGM